ncbi:SIMPL domain-containing protein [Algoriphagus sp.]|uniref:SIMPL domain-containing protein n=1 Tax=Algoriphagus sp. TaxID=1872435 RepID=UPI002728111C|nr:SIMPL domain-containing protein [Algoriphagus sp.]MDO8968683.1 SIMPL domain-containing protein [Algoriphagus sp.]MDP3200295.1 SIMPL domain-containing protein [Algoriphagus sp.]
MKKSILIVLASSILISSCRLNDSPETIEMIGISEKEIITNQLAVTINFIGDANQLQDFKELIEHGKLSEFAPKLQYQNVHQEEGGESKGKKLIYSIAYGIILKKGKDISELAEIVEKQKIPGFINSSGTYIDLAQIETLQTELFEAALKNAKNKIKIYADGLGKEFKVVEVSELDDMGSYINSLEGIIYNNRLGKKVKVKATLR